MVINSESDTGIDLKSTAIRSSNDNLIFEGKAEGYGIYGELKGIYQGKFMGPDAKQVAGAVSVAHMTEPTEGVSAVFIGEKQ